MKQVQKKGGSKLDIVVGLYIVGITLIMGYLINKYPRETMSDFPAGDVINAIAVGMASGLAATGVNQLYKQQCK